MIERKRINLQSHSRDKSGPRNESSLKVSTSRHKRVNTKKLNNSHLMKNSRSTRNINDNSRLRRTMSGLNDQKYTKNTSKNFGKHP
jgi:hypothetical protein